MWTEIDFQILRKLKHPLPALEPFDFHPDQSLKSARTKVTRRSAPVYWLYLPFERIFFWDSTQNLQPNDLVPPALCTHIDPPDLLCGRRLSLPAEDSHTHADQLLAHGSTAAPPAPSHRHKGPRFISAWMWSSDRFYSTDIYSHVSLVTVYRICPIVRGGWQCSMQLLSNVRIVLAPVNAFCLKCMEVLEMYFCFECTVCAACLCVRHSASVQSNRTKPRFTRSGLVFFPPLFITWRTHHSKVVTCERLKVQRIISAQVVPSQIHSDTHCKDPQPQLIGNKSFQAALRR